MPGNWCYTEDDLVVDKTGEFVTSYWLLQPTCANGGAGGDEIPVRNTDTFYLATWRGNVVDACPGVSPDDVCPPFRRRMAARRVALRLTQDSGT